MKKVRAALMGPRSSSEGKGLEAGLIELPETTVRKDIEINMSESLIDSIDNIEPNALVKAMVELSNKMLILGRRVGSLYQRELKEGSRARKERLTSMPRRKRPRRRRKRNGKKKGKGWQFGRYAA